MEEKRNENGFVVIPLSSLIINSEGKTGIPFETLRSEFGFSIMVKDSEVYIKERVGVVKSDERSKKELLISTDNFIEDSKILKKHFSFEEYYQGSLIYSSNLRGLNHYDILITENTHWYNITLRGDYADYCNQFSNENVIPSLIKFYFPINYETILSDIIQKSNARYKYDERDLLIRDYDRITKEIVFSKLDGKLLG